jgi:hypothetical protein
MWNRRRTKHSSPVEDAATARPESPVAPQADQETVATITDSRAASSSHSVAEWAIVALPPTTLLTGLAFWFGYALTASRNGYLGIDVSTLGFSTTDYLLRSIDALILPAITLLSLWLALLGVHSVIWPRVIARGAVDKFRRTFEALAVAGLLAIGLSIYFAFEELPAEAYLVPPALLGTGSITLAYAIRALAAMRRRGIAPAGGPARYSGAKSIQGVLAAQLVISLFWGATLYAGALGRGRAIDFINGLSFRPSVTVLSKTSLSLPPAVTETAITTADSEYRFRYTNLRLIIRSNERYFLLPEGWTRSTGTAILLEDTPNIRLEFSPGGQ